MFVSRAALRLGRLTLSLALIAFGLGLGTPASAQLRIGGCGSWAYAHRGLRYAFWKA